VNPARRSRPKPSFLAFTGCYAVYVLVIALSVVDFLIVRAAAGAIAGYLVRDITLNQLIYAAPQFVFGLVLFALVIGGEPYLRNGVQKGALIGRGLRLIVPLVILGVVGIVVVEVVNR
jgi:hypothetical protein